MLSIEKKQIAYNRAKRTSSIKYIVIHDTGNKSKGADSNAHFRYFNGAERGASADFFVDDATILQVNDYRKFYTYHVGDGKGKFGITNQNSVGIELCVNAGGDYQKTFENAVKLTKHLMKELSVPVEQVVRHYDASRKNCPASMAECNWWLWQAFLEKIKEDKAMDCPFCDIKGHYAETHIKELFSMGIVNGKDETHFVPNEPITRGDTAILIRNAIRYLTGR